MLALVDKEFKMSVMDIPKDVVKKVDNVNQYVEF